MAVRRNNIKLTKTIMTVLRVTTASTRTDVRADPPCRTTYGVYIYIYIYTDTEACGATSTVYLRQRMVKYYCIPCTCISQYGTTNNNLTHII